MAHTCFIVSYASMQQSSLFWTHEWLINQNSHMNFAWNIQMTCTWNSALSAYWSVHYLHIEVCTICILNCASSVYKCLHYLHTNSALFICGSALSACRSMHYLCTDLFTICIWNSALSTRAHPANSALSAYRTLHCMLSYAKTTFPHHGVGTRSTLSRIVPYNVCSSCACPVHMSNTRQRCLSNKPFSISLRGLADVAIWTSRSDFDLLEARMQCLSTKRQDFEFQCATLQDPCC
jgi:hypothetical protein